jgi:hypothetical protein
MTGRGNIQQRLPYPATRLVYLHLFIFVVLLGPTGTLFVVAPGKEKFSSPILVPSSVTGLPAVYLIRAGKLSQSLSKDEYIFILCIDK